MVKIKYKDSKRNKGCTSCGPSHTVMPMVPLSKHPLCGEEKSCFKEEPEECDEEVFDWSQLRYRMDCYDNNKLSNTGIEKGTRLDYFLEDLNKKIRNIDYIETPKVPGKPRLNTYQAIIADIYGVIEKQQEEIDKLKKELNVK